MKKNIKVGVLYRVVQEWRLPVFNRIQAQENIDLTVYHGPDFKGTKVVNSKSDTEFRKVELSSLKLIKHRKNNQLIAMPLSIFLFYRLIWERPDVIITEGASNLFNAIIGFIYCKLFGKKYIWWSLGKIEGAKFSKSRKRIDGLIRYLELNANAILCYSTIGKRYFTEIGVPDERIFVAVNVVDTDAKKTDIQKFDAEEIFNEFHQTCDFNALFVGALADVKKVDVLIDAFRKLHDDFGEKVALTIVGGGPDLEKLKTQAEGLPVHFAGKVFDGVSKYFLGGDVFVMPGLGGLAVSDALVHGLPVIASIGDGCEKDLITTGVNGIIDEKLDLERLYGHLKKMVEDPTKLAEMRREAKETIESKFNIGTYMDEIFKCVNYVIS